MKRSAGQTVARNFSVLSTASALDRLLRFVTFTYLARVLGVEFFGMISFAFTVQLFFQGAADFGLGVLGIREIATHRDKVRLYAANMLALMLILSLGAFILMQTAGAILRKDQATQLLFLLYGILVVFNIPRVSWILLGLEEMERVGAAIALRGIVGLGLVLVLVTRPEHLFRAAVIEACSGVLAGLILLALTVRRIGWFGASFDLRLWRGFMRNTAPLGVSRLLYRSYALVPILVLGTALSDTDVGAYRAGSLLPSFIAFVAATFASALFPTVSRVFSSDKATLSETVLGAYKFTIVGSVPVVATGVVLSYPLIRLAFGEAYLDSVSVLQILLIASLFQVPGCVIAESLLACHKNRFYLLLMLSKVAVVLLGSLILIWYQGILGAAVAVLSAEILGFAVAARSLGRTISHLGLHRESWKPMVSGLTMAAVLFLFAPSGGAGALVLAAGLGLLCYSFVFLVLLGGLSMQEIHFLRGLIPFLGRSN